MAGHKEGVDEDLSPWLCPDILGTTQPEIVAVAFQEIVELSPQQIMNSDPTTKQMWEKAVRRTLNNRAQRLGGEKYILLRSGQLVGAVLCIFVKVSALRIIKNVEGSVKKTGLSGIAGNKGAVSIRLDYANTPICFVTAHLAAGFANYEERNKDYATIHDGLRFQRNLGIDDHDTVIWLGDFNYRIGLSRERTMDLIRKRDLETMYENDQLNLQMVAGLAFPYYSEARITFLPTYRFDVGSDDYDSSEKQRIPAWTDRVLRKGSNIRQLSYNSAPLKFSDHRPVFATFDCTVNTINEALRGEISREIYERRKADVGDVGANIGGEDTDDEELMGYEAIEPGLPPASSDRQKWWLDNGKMARSTVQPPKANNTASHATILNPNRPSNPFVPTEEPDWVTVPRDESRLSSFSSLSSSPYEKINQSALLGGPASGQVTRKLPLPLESPPHKVGRVDSEESNSVQSQRGETPPRPPPRRQIGGTSSSSDPSVPPVASSAARTRPIPVDANSQTAVRKTAPAPPPPRPASSASGSSQHTAKSKSAPPVAKKPAYLASLSPSGSPKSQQSHEVEFDSPAVFLERSSASVRDAVSRYAAKLDRHRAYEQEEEPPQNPPRRAASVASMPPRNRTPVGAVGLVGLSGGGKEDRPRLPARKPTLPDQAPAAQVVKSPNVNLLDDDASVDVSGWETLQPI